jgi:DNA polymerase (family X)
MTGSATNAEIAQRLKEIRSLMEFAGEPFFKFMAYERAAEAVENAAPITDLVAGGRLQEVPGIGKTIAARVAELCATGTCAYLDELRARYPATILEVLEVPGVGMKTAQMLFERLGIGSLDDLQRAIEAGALAEIPRLGKKSIENIKRGVLSAKGRARRTPLGEAAAKAAEIVAYLAARTSAADLTPAGSVRRHEATVGDIDIVCTSDNPEAVIAAFTGWSEAEAVLSEGSTKASIWLPDALQVDLRVLPAHLYGNLLQHFTGSREHNIQLREQAVRANLRVSENGIVDLRDGKVVTCRTEAEVYATLGMAEIPPEMRLGLGELEAARDGTLPAVVSQIDLRGDVHVHVGPNTTLEDLAAAAIARGYEYITVIGAQAAPAASIGERFGVRLLTAADVGIAADGSLTAPEELLAGMDLVVASVRADLDLPRDAMTRRLIRACENPYLTVITHLTGRRVGGDPGYAFDHDAVFAAAARTGTALDIDGRPDRLDLPGSLARRAKEFGVTFACCSGASNAADMAHVAFAIGQARRGWVTAAEVLNARPLAGVLAFAGAKRKAASHAGRPADP